ncbi:uncharacterized protein DC041_0008656, partial [Schistosoma bovis]
MFVLKILQDHLNGSNSYSSGLMMTRRQSLLRQSTMSQAEHCNDISTPNNNDSNNSTSSCGLETTKQNDCLSNCLHLLHKALRKLFFEIKYLFIQEVDVSKSLMDFLSSVTGFISDVCNNAESINFEDIIDEYETKSASLIRPLFNVDDDCYVGLTGDGHYSSRISPDVNKSLKLQESSSVYPKLINFVYPSEDEIKAHCDTVYITASTSVNKPIDLTSPDFDDSFTGFDLTQIMNVSEVTSCKSVDFSLDSHLTSFKTGKGDSVTLMNSSSRKFARTLVDSLNICDDDVNVEKSHENHDSHFTGFKTGKGDSVTLMNSSSRKFARTLVDSLNICDDDVNVEKSHENHDSHFTGFKTGKGDSVTLMNSSSRKFARTLVDSLNICDDDVNVEKSHENHDSHFTGFKTGKGDSVTLMNSSSRKFARTLVDSLNICDDDVNVEKSHENHDSHFTGFKTGKGDSVTLMNSSSRKFARTLVDSLNICDDDVNVEKSHENHDSHFTGFKTGKGDSVTLMNSSSRKFARTLTDPSISGDVFVKLEKCYESYDYNAHNVKDNLLLSEEQIAEVHDDFGDSSHNYIDSFSGCFDTQFDLSFERSEGGIHMMEINISLDVEREKARVDQQNLIAHNQSIPSPSQHVLSTSDTSLNTTLYGLLWNIRRRYYGTEILNSTNDQSLLKWKVLLADYANHQKLSVSSTPLYLPKYLKFSNDTHNKWSLQTADKLYWLLDMKHIIDTKCESSLPISYKFHDFILIPDKFGCVGRQEIINDLCATLLSDYCAPIHVLNELRYRYDRERNLSK